MSEQINIPELRFPEFDDPICKVWVAGMILEEYEWLRIKNEEKEHI